MDITGTSGADTLTGTAGNDRITGGGGNDTIHGGDGYDNVVFSDVFANYSVSEVSGGKIQSAQSFTITHLNDGSDGVDTIYMDVEFFDFADRTSVPRATLLSASEEDDGEIITGTEGNDGNLTGTSGNDIINALGGNDTIVGSAGSDTISGGDGLDVLSFSTYSSDDIQLSSANDVVTVSFGGAEDTLTGVERIQLSDTWLALDFNGGAGNAAKVICAGFGQEYLSQYLSVGIGFADSGLSMDDLSSLVVNSGLMTHDGSSKGFVNEVFNNLLGRDANALEELMYVNYLDDGLYSEAQLLTIASETALANSLMVEYAIDNVGLPYDAGLV